MCCVLNGSLNAMKNEMKMKILELAPWWSIYFMDFYMGLIQMGDLFKRGFKIILIPFQKFLIPLMMR